MILEEKNVVYGEREGGEGEIISKKLIKLIVQVT